MRCHRRTALKSISLSKRLLTICMRVKRGMTRNLEQGGCVTMLTYSCVVSISCMTRAPRRAALKSSTLTLSLGLNKLARHGQTRRHQGISNIHAVASASTQREQCWEEWRFQNGRVRAADKLASRQAPVASCNLLAASGVETCSMLSANRTSSSKLSYFTGACVSAQNVCILLLVRPCVVSVCFLWHE